MLAGKKRLCPVTWGQGELSLRLVVPKMLSGYICIGGLDVGQLLFPVRALWKPTWTLQCAVWRAGCQRAHRPGPGWHDGKTSLWPWDVLKRYSWEEPGPWESKEGWKLSVFSPCSISPDRRCECVTVSKLLLFSAEKFGSQCSTFVLVKIHLHLELG